MNIDPEVRRPARLRSSFYAGGMYLVDGVGRSGAVSDLRMTANLNRYVKEVP
jgi:hypothetical protein